MQNILEKKWYVISTITGHESKVKTFLEQESPIAQLDDKILSIFIPTEKVYEVKDKKKKTKTKNLFPGYVYIEAVLEEKVKQFIQNAPSVRGFVGVHGNPSALTPAEIKRIIGSLVTESLGEDGAVIRVEVPFQIGEAVKVTSGPFNNFSGFVQEINTDKMKVKVMVSIFGRKTPIELDFSQVEIEK